MCNLWNLRDLPIPVMSTCRIDDKNLNLQFYRKKISEAVSTFENQTHLHAEATLLSRYIYRMKTKLRSDKGLKEMQKVNTAVRRYLTLDLPKALHQFLEFLPKNKGAEVYYPTLGNLDYILIRLQGTAKLMIRAADCARHCALYMKNRISIGHLWKVAYIALGIVARLFALSKNFVKVCCSLYNDLFPMREFLSDSSGYVGEDYVFPKRLEQWLNEDWLFEETVIEDVVIDVNEKLQRFRSIDEDSDVEFSGEYLEIDEDIEYIDEYVDITGRQKGDVSITSTNNESVAFDEEKHEISGIEEISKTVADEEEDIGEVISDNSVDVDGLEKVKLDSKQKSHKKMKLDFQGGYKFISQEEDIGEAVVSRINKSTGLTRKELKILKRKSSEISNIYEESAKRLKVGDDKGIVKKKKKNLNKTDKLEKTKKDHLSKAQKSSEIIDAIILTTRSEDNLDDLDKINEFVDADQESDKNTELSNEVKLSKATKKKKNNLHHEIMNDSKGIAKKKKKKLKSNNTDGINSTELLKSQIKHNKGLNRNKNIKKKVTKVDKTGSKKILSRSEIVKDDVNMDGNNLFDRETFQIKNTINQTIKKEKISNKNKSNNNTHSECMKSSNEKRNTNINQKEKHMSQSQEIETCSKTTTKHKFPSKKIKNKEPVRSLQNNETQVVVKSNESIKKNKINSPLSTRNVIKSIKSISQLKVFVAKENKIRDVNVKKCKLKHLNKMQWNMLNNLVTDLVQKAKKNETKSSKCLKKGKEALLMNVK